MIVRKPTMKFLWLAALLLATLACRAATRLVIPDTPTPLPTATTTPTLTPTPPPTFTPTAVVEAACTPLLSEILHGLPSEVLLPGKRADQAFREDGAIFIISYKVNGDRLSSPHVEQVPDPLEDEQNDRSTHEDIWEYFTRIIPEEQRGFLSEFSIFTDGRGSHLAAVSASFPNPEEWGLHVDILDAKSYHELTYTLIHEQGHLLTLNATQVVPSKSIFRFPNNETVYQKEVAACPQYFTGEGCSNPESYINQFFERFWTYIYPAWEPIELEEDENTQAAMIDDFYDIHRDQFLSHYAATSPNEDIAESWTHFILAPKPELTSIANEKILFFYEYPELVQLRAQILTQICREFPQ